MNIASLPKLLHTLGKTLPPEMAWEGQEGTYLAKFPGIAIVINGEQVGKAREELINLLGGESARSFFTSGLSHLSIGALFGEDYVAALTLFTVGEQFGFWEVVTPEDLGIHEKDHLLAMTDGYVMIAGGFNLGPWPDQNVISAVITRCLPQLTGSLAKEEMRALIALNGKKQILLEDAISIWNNHVRILGQTAPAKREGPAKLLLDALKNAKSADQSDEAHRNLKIALDDVTRVRDDLVATQHRHQPGTAPPLE